VSAWRPLEVARWPRWVRVLFLGLVCGCASAADSDLRAVGKIRFDLSALDAVGLYGPADGLRALDYEFCIPDRAQAVATVRGIDASLRVHRSPGRIGCADDELLCIGTTLQPGYRDVLAALSRLSYVTRIERAFFE
jgi:hypothetical protein